MKSVVKKNKNNISMTVNRENKELQKYYKGADLRIRLAVEIYNAREAIGWSQQRLAKETDSTQKIISRIENGDVNIGIEMLGRLAEKLNFDSRNLAKIFNCHSFIYGNPISALNSASSTVNPYSVKSYFKSEIKGEDNKVVSVNLLLSNK